MSENDTAAAKVALHVPARVVRELETGWARVVVPFLMEMTELAIEPKELNTLASVIPFL